MRTSLYTMQDTTTPINNTPKEASNILHRVKAFESYLQRNKYPSLKITLPNNDFLLDTSSTMDKECSTHRHLELLHSLRLGSVFCLHEFVHDDGPCSKYLVDVMIVDLFQCSYHGSMVVFALLFDTKTVRDAALPGCIWPDQLQGDRMPTYLLSNKFYAMKESTFSASQSRFTIETVSPFYGFNFYLRDLEEFDGSCLAVNRAFTSYHGPIMETFNNTLPLELRRMVYRELFSPMTFGVHLIKDYIGQVEGDMEGDPAQSILVTDDFETDFADGYSLLLTLRDVQDSLNEIYVWKSDTIHDDILRSGIASSQALILRRGEEGIVIPLPALVNLNIRCGNEGALTIPPFNLVKNCLKVFSTLRKVTITISELNVPVLTERRLAEGMALIEAINKRITWDVTYGCDTW
ncbi:hypothetical protein BU24DRAFT_477657 [Aaosphaeria arxii CBS 175.79]|uniref:Uncharacterized protein n=1 Tax=Aaosphaeria arxii CBS 175.79 TaxID=1450172 RepID=A0A6A5X5U0_9PLEO|nr:uncharacterized protein BU24DRAFT_477657 [Aaosphaeria arxii CBS 175.79]KAF2008309.1 hypothetical protein BU24DRAFT_477657 [Aaosphaeria arxii CBS 175.79]